MVGGRMLRGSGRGSARSAAAEWEKKGTAPALSFRVAKPYARRWRPQAGYNSAEHKKSSKPHSAVRPGCLPALHVAPVSADDQSRLSNLPEPDRPRWLERRCGRCRLAQYGKQSSRCRGAARRRVKAGQAPRDHARPCPATPTLSCGRLLAWAPRSRRLVNNYERFAGNQVFTDATWAV
jgi:hypothetical protein